MPQQAFFFDFDGTLYSHDAKRVSESARDALLGLRSRGHLVAVATGRGPESLPFIQRELAVPCDAMIFLNGQVVYWNEKKLVERFITLPSIRGLIAEAKDRGLAYGGYYRDGEIVNRLNERVVQVWNDFRCPQPVVMEHFEDVYPLYQGHLYVSREEAEEMKELLADYVMNWPHRWMANLISREAGKSQGIRRIMSEAGIPLERSFAFGDGFNDVDMLQTAGHGIVMGNATEELKRSAEHVTGTVDEDGVYQALRFYNLI
ncbi:Cof-type HAD-IIB family hydrolase [Paenibacillus sp. TRM 82003]|nr:Cof-type HAD-IIB family hydrolase [Paenibacillus sp. TRM 82003]